MIKPTTKYTRVLVRTGPITNTGGGGSWAGLSGRPALFPPEPHNHTLANITDAAGLVANVTTLQAEVLALTNSQALVGTIAADLKTHNHTTASVIGLDIWMKNRLDDITGLTATAAAKAPLIHNHTSADITDFAAQMATRAATVHQHPISDVTGLAQALANATGNHTHAMTGITGLPACLTGLASDIAALTVSVTTKAALTRYATTSQAGLVKIGKNLTVSSDGTLDAAASVSTWANITGRPSEFTPAAHTHSQSDITNLPACLTGLKSDITAVDGKLTNYAVVGHKHASTADVIGLDAALTHVNGCCTQAALQLTQTTACLAQVATDLKGKADAAKINACISATDTEVAKKIDAVAAEAKYAHANHTHVIGDVTGLRPELDGLKANITASAIPPSVAADINSLKANLAANTTTLTATTDQLTACLTGLKLDVGNRLLTTDANARFARIGHSHFIADTFGLQAALDRTHAVAVAGNFTLPIASGGTLGGVKVGNGLATITDGTLSVDSTKVLMVLDKGTANGVASLGPDGKVPQSQIGALAIANTYVLANETQRLAVTGASRGDVAVQTEDQHTFILKAVPANVPGNWVRLLNAANGVLTVNNKTGSVNLIGSDLPNNVWAINGFTGNVTLTGSDIANNVASFNGRHGNVNLTRGDLPLADAAFAGVSKPDGTSVFIDSNGTLSTTVPYTKAEVDAKIDTLVTGIVHGLAVYDIASTPPAAPVVDTPYIVGPAATGDFATYEDKIAIWNGTKWTFSDPINSESHLVETQSATYHWNGTAWVKIATATTAAVSNGELHMVGDMKMSALTEPQFKLALGSVDERKWALADGRDVSTSAYARITGRTTLPDLRGAFIRMAGNNTNPGWAGGALNSYGEDSTARPKIPFTTDSSGNHNHSFRRNPGVFSGDTRYGDATFSPINAATNGVNISQGINSAGDHTHTITGGGDTETRPKHYSMNFFIKID